MVLLPLAPRWNSKQQVRSRATSLGALADCALFLDLRPARFSPRAAADLLESGERWLIQRRAKAHGGAAPGADVRRPRPAKRRALNIE